MNVLLWFRSDLRVENNAALVRAAALGRVLPVHVADPGQWRAAGRSARQWAFVADSLAGLAADLTALGLPLVLRCGDSVEVLDRLWRAHRFGHMVSTSVPPTLAGCATEGRVGDWAAARGIAWERLPALAGGRQAMGGGPILPVAGVAPGTIVSARALGLADDPCPHRQAGGRQAGLVLVARHLAAPGVTGRGSAGLERAERVASRLSPHLAQGTIAADEVLAAGGAGALAAGLARRAAMTRAAVAPGAGPVDALPEGARLPDAGAGLAVLLGAETGLPVIDAAMRHIRATGWAPASLRSLVLTFGTGLLGLCPRALGREMAALFTDHDPVLHWGHLRRIAGLGGMGEIARAGRDGCSNAPRIENPVARGRRLDPEGRFVRRWLPELAPVPDIWLHEPWKWAGAAGLLGRRYPEAVVDPASASRRARAVLGPARPGTARRDPAPRWSGVIDVDDGAARAQARAAARRDDGAGQLSLDL